MENRQAESCSAADEQQGAVTDPFTKTRYRVAQHWRFRLDTPVAQDTFVVTAVEDHPVQGIVCAIQIKYDPEFRLRPNCTMPGDNFWFTQAALDVSVIEMVAEKGPFPRHLGTTGEFRCTAESWEASPHPFAKSSTVGEAISEAYSRLERQRDEYASYPPYSPPPDDALGLWSLIACDKVDRLCELLQQHPTLASDPLPNDPTDDYYDSGVECEECFPLMLAAEHGSVEVAGFGRYDLGAIQSLNTRTDYFEEFGGVD